MLDRRESLPQFIGEAVEGFLRNMGVPFGFGFAGISMARIFMEESR